MSDDKNDKAGGLLTNPLPILMAVLLAAGVLVKMPPLESARPTDPERMKFVSANPQDVEARLWQDPFVAVEQHEKNSNQAVTPAEEISQVMGGILQFFASSDQAVTPATKASPAPHPPEALLESIKKHHDVTAGRDRPNARIEILLESIKKRHDVTVVAVSVFGGSFNEMAESRRRSRFAVISALGFHSYHPEDADALGYFHIDLPESGSKSATANVVKLTVPYEWFKRRDKSSSVLVLWLNQDKFSTTEPLNQLSTLFNKLTPKGLSGYLRVKLIGPAGSAMLADLVRENKNKPDLKQKPMVLESGSTLEIFSPGATISSCDLSTPDASEDKLSRDCIQKQNFTRPKALTSLPVIRTTGTDDVLAAALLWELWQRGINSNHACKDGLVLIGERDTEYGRTLSRYLKDGFSGRCGANPDENYDKPRDKPPVRMFTYLRGLDGVLPNIDKSGSNASPKDNNGKSNTLRAQLEDAPPEHAEGRNQLDYLRRLADEIDRLDRDNEHFAENGVKAIGIIGSDVYDKLLILQSLRSRFKDKIFFTTDLDARYLHADQKDWARNLVVASNFGLSLRPELQRSNLPFRDSYQTATYLATLMALEKPPLNGWSGKMKDWLPPQIFEIGRTEAVHLASPSADALTNWINYTRVEGYAPPMPKTECGVDSKGNVDWRECKRIQPDPLLRGISTEHWVAIPLMLILSIMLATLTIRPVHETVRARFNKLSPEHVEAKAIISYVIGAVGVVLMTLAVVWILWDAEITQGIDEPFVWLEGISVWPSLVLRFIGLVTLFILGYVFLKKIQQQEKTISEDLGIDFKTALPQIRTPMRRWWSAAWSGPYFNLASFDQGSKADVKSPEKAKIITLWQSYLRATRLGEMWGWILVSFLVVFGLFIATSLIFDLHPPSFPHRGQLVWWLHFILLFCGVSVLWSAIFWVSYETRACVQFIESLSDVSNKWSKEPFVCKAEKETGLPREHLDAYLDFQLITRATERILRLIYLPFVSILFMVLARSNFFAAMDFPLVLVLFMGLALAYSLHSARLLRKSAETARTKTLENYEKLLLGSTLPQIRRINSLMDRIRNTRNGAFAPFGQQPALQALLLPFGGYGGVQLIEYLLNV
ncbi:MAG: hypothetical protein AABY81_04545 [Pseudomonadota bacterium]